MQTFFPSLIFAWLYVGVLFALLLVASGTDLRIYVVPKGVSITALALGLIGNIIRGAWLGAEGHSVWILGENGAFVGAIDGLLFAAGGFLTGFALFFVMWMIGVCGGGDVKLFGALGAWIGIYLAVWVLMVSLPVILLFAIGQMAFAIAGGGWKAARAGAAAGGQGKPPLDTKKRVLGFSLPLTIATALVVLWKFRDELNLVASTVN